MNLLAKIARGLDGVITFFSFLAGVLLAFMLLSVCLEVLMRYFLNRPLQWVIELTEYALLYITFLGAAWLLRRDGHITVDVFVGRLSAKTQALLNVFSSLIGMLICAFLVWYGFAVSWDHYQRGVYNITILEFPKAPILVIIPLGSLILLLQFMRRASGSLADLRGKRRRPEH